MTDYQKRGADCTSWGGCVFGLVGKGEVLEASSTGAVFFRFQGDGLGNGNVFCPATALRVAGAVFPRYRRRSASSSSVMYLFRISMKLVCNAVVRVGNSPHHLLHLRGRDTIGKKVIFRVPPVLVVTVPTSRSVDF